MPAEHLLKILFAGDYLKDYNRTLIIREGLKKLGHQIVEFSFQKKNRTNRKELQTLAQDCDFIFMPSFTHQQVGFVRCAVPDKKIIFDPLISRYLTKVHDYKLVSPYGISALRNYFRDKWSQKHADFVVTDTEAHRAYFHKKFKTPLEKMGVLYIGNNFDEFCPNPNPTKNNKFIVGFYGGFIPLQGVLNIVDAAAQLREHTDIEFHLIGNGFQYDLVKQKIAELSLKNLVLPGWQKTPELIRSVQGFDLALGIFGDTEKSDFVIPNKVYHYAACAKAMVTKDSPAIRELFQDDVNIVLIQPTTAALTTAILKLKADSPRRTKLGHKAYEMLKTNWDEVSVARKLIYYYETYCKKAPSVS